MGLMVMIGRMLGFEVFLLNRFYGRSFDGKEESKMIPWVFALKEVFGLGDGCLFLLFDGPSTRGPKSYYERFLQTRTVYRCCYDSHH